MNDLTALARPEPAAEAPPAQKISARHVNVFYGDKKAIDDV